MTRKEAIIQLRLGPGINEDVSEEYNDAVNIAIDALEQEPKRGKWIDRASELDAGFRRHEFVCSECSTKANYYVGGSEDWWDTQEPNYCPNCGAAMGYYIKPEVEQ